MFLGFRKMSRSFLIVYSVATFYLLATEAAHWECFTPGECTDSYQLTGSIANDQYDCRKRCQSLLNCAWFTYFQKTSYCQLYKNCFLLDLVSCQDCLSGEKDCSAPQLKCSMTGNCSNQPFHSESASDSEVCLDLCKSNITCQWFTHDSSTGSCKFYTECDSLIGCDTCISGNSNCIFDARGRYF
jgi:hypothetical protein